MKMYAVMVLVVIALLNSCAVIVHNNWGNNINDSDKSTMDDMVLSQEYDVTSKNNKRK